MRKMSLLVGTCAVAVLLAGCVSDVWLKSGVSGKQFDADVANCAKKAGILTYVKASPDKNVSGSIPMGSDLERAAYEKCMTGKGYKKEK